MPRQFATPLLVAAVLVCSCPIPAMAATARTYGSFQVKTSHDRTVAWYEAHRASVLAASNCRILENLGGGQYRVQTNTPGGACQYIIQETREQRKTKDGKQMTIYRVKYVRNVSGRLADFELTIAMTGQTDAETEFGMWMMANVSGRFVPVFAVSRVLESSKAGCMEYVVGNAR